MFVELALDHLLGRLHDERAALRIEQTKIMVRLGRGPFQ